MYVFVCHDDPDSIFTAIYDAWASRLRHKNIRILAKEPENYELFCEYIHVTTNAEKSRKVADTIRRRLGVAASPVLFQAIMADESGIAGSGRRSSSSSFSITKAGRALPHAAARLLHGVSGSRPRVSRQSLRSLSV